MKCQIGYIALAIFNVLNLNIALLCMWSFFHFINLTGELLEKSLNTISGKDAYSLECQLSNDDEITQILDFNKTMHLFNKNFLCPLPRIDIYARRAKAKHLNALCLYDVNKKEELCRR